MPRALIIPVCAISVASTVETPRCFSITQTHAHDYPSLEDAKGFGFILLVVGYGAVCLQKKRHQSRSYPIFSCSAKTVTLCNRMSSYALAGNPCFHHDWMVWGMSLLCIPSVCHAPCSDIQRPPKIAVRVLAGYPKPKVAAPCILEP